VRLLLILDAADEPDGASAGRTAIRSGPRIMLQCPRSSIFYLETCVAEMATTLRQHAIYQGLWNMPFVI